MEKCLCMCSACQSDGWWKCVPGLWFMKVKGPWGWPVKHIISVKLLDWMNQHIFIKHLWEDLELVEACAHPTSHSLAALVTRPYHLGMKLKCFSGIHLGLLELHYYAVIHILKMQTLTPFTRVVMLSCQVLCLWSLSIQWVLSLRGEY